jgi:peptidoglycan/LPS O-acetylase OafA/YrhL
MTLYLVQAVTFFILSLAYIVRDFPWKNWNSKSKRRVSLTLLAIALVGIIAMPVILFTGTMGEDAPPWVQMVTLASIGFFVITVTLSIFVWPRKREGEK